MKDRTQGDRLTAPEIERIRKAFRAGVHSHVIADELLCSPRTTNKYYRMFRGCPLPRGRPKQVKQVPLKPTGQRFYTSTFEL